MANRRAKQPKNYRIPVLVSFSERAKIRKLAERHKKTMGELIRWLCSEEAAKYAENQ